MYKPVVDSDKTCIYALIDPRNESVRYIGKSDNPTRRIKGHLRDVRDNLKCHRVSWIKELMLNGLMPKVKILFTPKKENWQEVESQTIAHYKQFCDLVNMTDGGDGQMEGHIPWNKGKKGVYDIGVISRMKKTRLDSYIDGTGGFKLNPEKVNEIVTKYMAGSTSTELAKEYGVSSNAILVNLRHCGIETARVISPSSIIRSNVIKKINVPRKDIVDYYHKTQLSTKDIGAHFGISAQVVSSALLKSGISARKNRGRLVISKETRGKMSASHKLINNSGRFNKGFHSWNAKPVFQFTKDGVFIKEWISANDARVNLGVKNIMKCISGERKVAGGFIWKRHK